MRILLTNDDGIDSEGLHVLARAMNEHGDVVIVAPDSEYSGSSASFGSLQQMHPVIRRAEVDGVPEAWSLTGPPALCVIFARLGVFDGPFDLVVSGINPGANVGRAVAHSGTIGAVVTGRLGGISGVAVSQAVDEWSVEGQALTDTSGAQRWDTAALVAADAVGALIADLPAEPVMLNLNVPNVAPDELKGWRRTTVATAPIRAVQQARLEPIADDPGAFRGILGWGEAQELPVETDGGAVEAGLVSATWLAPIQPTDPPGVATTEAALDGLLGAT
jgi:5'-nucleotidase